MPVSVWARQRGEEGFKMAYRISKDQCAGCGVCVDTCKQTAIVPDDDKYKILKEKCIACGDCANACPVGCIAPEDK